MPWPEPQRRAIFLSIMRKKGKASAKRFMHAHGYGGDKGHHLKRALSRKRS